MREWLGRRLWKRERPPLEVIPPHESPLHRMMADATGEKYEAVATLGEAQRERDFAVVMQGDDGGSIYLTCPARLVECDEETLQQLLFDLDAHSWREPDMAGLFYEHAPVGSSVAGGTGGGVVTDGLWLHPELVEKGLYERVQAVVKGRRPRI